MPEYIYLIIIAFVIVLAAVLLYLLQAKLGREKEHFLRERIKIVQEYEDEADKANNKHISEMNNLNEQIKTLAEERSSLKSQIAASKEYETRLMETLEAAKKESQEQHLKDLQAMKDTFAHLSDANSEAFRTKSEQTIAELMKPVQEKFKEFSESVKASQEKSIERHSKLEQRIADLDLQSKTIGEEARNLANALTGYSKVQGNYGEMLLIDVLKSSGLTEGVHFKTQGVITDESGREIKSDTGKTMIPDVIVFYPDDTSVIVDSKVSLTAFNEYMNSTTVEDREKYAKEHINSILNHVEELRTKNYAAYIPEGKRKVDYNIMFIPIEGAFRLMLDKDPLLWQKAKDNNVLIVSQMTLTIVLNMIQMSWRQHDQEKNIQQVYKTASELMSQMRNWMDSYVKVGDYLKKVQDSYDESTKKLMYSQQSALKKGDSMIKQIEKLEKLGLAPKTSTGKINTSSRNDTQSSIIPSKLLPDEEQLDVNSENISEQSDNHILTQ